jgi:hypothetical protein
MCQRWLRISGLVITQMRSDTGTDEVTATAERVEARTGFDFLRDLMGGGGSGLVELCQGGARRRYCDAIQAGRCAGTRARGKSRPKRRRGGGYVHESGSRCAVSRGRAPAASGERGIGASCRWREGPEEGGRRKQRTGQRKRERRGTQGTLAPRAESASGERGWSARAASP